MTARAQVFALLVANEGRWVTRAEIEEVGGLEALRRLREVKTQALGQGYAFEQRRVRGVLEYRVYELAELQAGIQPWVCVKCGGHPTTVLQPTTDAKDRWRMGPCPVCGLKDAIFAKA